jgi:hypothetical protein
MNELVKYDPYRCIARIDTQPVVKPKYGLIRYVDKYKHDCNLPGPLKRLWYRLTFRAINRGSVIRCHCGKVYELRCIYDTIDSYESKWKEQRPKIWEEAGGDISE